MRFLRVIPLLFAIAVIWLLNHRFSTTLPALGKMLDPINGLMAAAEPVNQDFNKNLHLKDLRAPVSVWMEDRLVPHVRAQNDHDLYYTQGYLHAYFRLWQMDIQTRAAAGRVSEVVGPKTIDYDRGQRRKGMVWGAQKSLAAMEADPRTKAMIDAYRDGINAYIHSLNARNLPLEYKLMDFYPEEWTNLRTALMTKNLADDLTSKTDDIAYTVLRDQLGQEQFDFLFPEKLKGSKPVIPEGTKFEKPSQAQPAYPGDKVWAHFGDAAQGKTSSSTNTSQRLCHSVEIHSAMSRSATNRFLRNDKDQANGFPSESEDANSEIAEGSNNWAISGSHTASGKPILCNDPHLALNLPSLWYEMQLSAPGINVYGASLPGAPGIVIGFNQKISWGFTNNYRDVRDFYEIVPYSKALLRREHSENVVPADEINTPAGKRKLGLEDAYLFNGRAVYFDMTVEVIKVKNRPDITDTVLYTIHGPVTYDPSFPAPLVPPSSGGNQLIAAKQRGEAVRTKETTTKLLATTWMAHRGSNELLATYQLNRALDYTAFTDAIQHFECPAQNIAYADGAGNIAMWAQGRFINKWKGQGKYVMRGDDSSTLWGADIPMAENPHVLNPPQGYVASANQTVTDSTYPYWYNQSATEWRSWEINEALDFHFRFTKGIVIPLSDSPEYLHISCHRQWPLAQNGLQNDVGNLLAVSFIPSWECRANNPILDFSSFFKDSLNNRNWLGEMDYSSAGATKFQIFLSQLYKDIWQDDFPNAPKWPSSEVTVQLLLSDSASRYYDDKTTPQKETLRDIVQRAFRETTDSLSRLTKNESTSQRVNESTNLQWYRVKNTTLTHLAKIPAFSYDHLKIGGWSNTINACTGDHGPSWRMIVEMDSIPKAYVVYPGGQSGNPGSPHYGDFIEHWVEGKYFTTQFLTAATTKNPFKYAWTLTP